MQRILSVETSRNVSQANSEFVTKRFCCSFLLTVAFFSIVGGFLLGKFVSDRALEDMIREMYQVTTKVQILNINLQDVFQSGLNLSISEDYIFLHCNFLAIGRNNTGMLAAAVYLTDLNECFNNG
ncbi:uncharacterized protein LOC109536887 [Dendroctonus ponderosae]|uniref:Uncharacterized protein n=1 Tax=Dendroctonus ponderosae TaxID=77166 RepID=A0AAR5PCU7_DENPD|nr:uncharacterized protein LOC109536887 [Dendroctonus ponderosae]KAH1007872.1 hypothetical protein HUJ04_005052 [Dendroctonus ponderosae]KAH1015372.1 hypothetical protein HUJ05_013104 [Dendroctonus ponderosae]